MDFVLYTVYSSFSHSFIDGIMFDNNNNNQG